MPAISFQLEKPNEVAKGLENFADRCARKQATVSSQLLKSYAGQYKFGDRVLTLTVEGNHLLGQIDGEGGYFFYPESQSRFYSRVQQTDIEFQKDSSGKVSGVVIDQAETVDNWQRI